MRIRVKTADGRDREAVPNSCNGRNIHPSPSSHYPLKPTAEPVEQHDAHHKDIPRQFPGILEFHPSLSAAFCPERYNLSRPPGTSRLARLHVTWTISSTFDEIVDEIDLTCAGL